METPRVNFRFVEAGRLDTVLGRLGNEMHVQTPDKRCLGRLVGVVVDPDHHRVQYLVVISRSWFKTRRYLVPLAAARLTADRRAIEVDVKDDELQTTADDAAALAAFFPPTPVNSRTRRDSYFITPMKTSTSSRTRISTIASSRNWPRDIDDCSTAKR